jgi:hypothetical protein
VYGPQLPSDFDVVQVCGPAGGELVAPPDGGVLLGPLGGDVGGVDVEVGSPGAGVPVAGAPGVGSPGVGVADVGVVAGAECVPSGPGVCE